MTRNRDSRTITLTQAGYIKELACQYKGKFTESYSPTGPERGGEDKFRRLQPSDSGPDTITSGAYIQLIGSLLWPANMTRPDIAYHCSKLATFCRSASEEHMRWGYHVLGYLVKTSHLGITYGGPLQVPCGLNTHPPGFLQSLGLHVYHNSS